ncbi:MAG: hypothetical protein ACRD3S_02115, partial [Terracidiphilus sp.]
MTDLSYRTDFEIPDILASQSGTHCPENTLYTGDRILTSSPITQNDYRNLLYDRIKGLKNAWLVPVTDHPQGIQGIYDVLIELREEIEDPSGAEAMEIKDEALKLMRRTRNLGEDLGAIEILKPQKVRIEGTIVIDPHAEPAHVLASVLFEIQNSMIPFPQVQLVDEIFHRMPPEDIWSGPMLNLGALDQRSLRPIETTVRVQEIANIILEVPGVKRVKNLKLGNTNGPMRTDFISLEKHHVPRIDPPILKNQEAYPIQVELEGGFKSVPDPRAVHSKIRELEAAMRSSIAYAVRSLSALSYLKVPVGIDRNISTYFSIQHQFPAIYGLGRFGMASRLIEFSKPRPQAHTERLARIRQLRAYLLVFEQSLADYLAQLANVSELFSLNPELDRSYFYQPLAHDPPHPDDPPNILEVMLRSPDHRLESATHYQVCVVDPRGEIVFASNIQHGLDEATEIQQRILECGQSIQSFRSSTAASGEVRLVLHAKNNAVLAHGQERFTSIAASRKAAEYWVRFFVILLNDRRRLEDAIKIFPHEELTFQVVDERSRIVLLGRRSDSIEDRDRRVEEMLDCGADRQSYRLLTRGQGEFEVGLLNREGTPIAKGNEIFATQKDADDGVNALVALLQSMATQKSVRDLHLRILPEVAKDTPGPLNAYKNGLANLARSMDRNFLARRNRFLDHLLARFAEQFDDQILERLDLRPYGEKDGFYAELMQWKIEFLRNYVQQGDTLSASVGGGRARGFDYSVPEDAEHPDNSSAFERRILMLLGMSGHMTEKGYRANPKRPTSEPGYFYMEEDRGRATMQGEPDPRNLHENFVFASEDSSVFRQLLGSGANPNFYKVQQSGPTYNILFRPPDSKEDVTIHQAPSRAEADRRVAELVRFFSNLRRNSADCYGGERLYLVEHLLLRPEGETQACRLHLSDEKSRIQLSSISIPRRDREDHAALILKAGQDKANYRVKRHPSGEYSPALYVGEREIAAARKLFTDKAEAEKEKAELARLVRSHAARPNAREALLKTTVTDDFYSHRISVIFPNWPMRFQNNEFKLYAEQTIYENAPAY